MYLSMVFTNYYAYVPICNNIYAFMSIMLYSLSCMNIVCSLNLYYEFEYTCICDISHVVVATFVYI